MTSIQRSARGEGLIRLGFIRPLGVEFIPALASEFLKRNGDLEVQFTFHTGVTAQLLDGLKVGSYDLVFCSEPPENLNLTAIPVQNRNWFSSPPRDIPLPPENLWICRTPSLIPRFTLKKVRESAA